MKRMKELGFEEINSKELLTSGGFMPIGVDPFKYISNIMAAMKFIKEYGDDFIDGFKEGWNSFDYTYKYRN